MPNLAALVKRHAEDDFALLAVNTGDSKSVFRKGVERHHVVWDVLYQGEKAEVAKLYRVKAYPTIYVLDRKGRIRFQGLRGEGLAKAVATLLAEKPTR